MEGKTKEPFNDVEMSIFRGSGKPTDEVRIEDLKNKNFSTFTYNKESDIPDIFKDKITSISDELDNINQGELDLKGKDLIGDAIDRIANKIGSKKNLTEQQKTETTPNVEDWSRDVESTVNIVTGKIQRDLIIKI